MSTFEQKFIKFIAFLFGTVAVILAIRLCLHVFGIGFHERLF